MLNPSQRTFREPNTRNEIPNFFNISFFPQTLNTISTGIMSMNKSGTLGIIITLSIAMVGATIAASYGALQAQALKSGTSIAWCYETLGAGGGGTVNQCFRNHGDCNKAQDSDSNAKSSCFKKRF